MVCVIVCVVLLFNLFVRFASFIAMLYGLCFGCVCCCVFVFVCLCVLCVCVYCLKLIV